MKARLPNFYNFQRAFKDMGRDDNFSYAGLKALFDYLEDYEEATGEETELDVISLCCDFTEYESLEDFQADYGDEYETIEDIRDSTTVIDIADEDGKENGNFIIQNF